MNTVTTARIGRAGDPNRDILLDLPPEALELIYEHHANELTLALRELADVLVGNTRPRDLNVDALFELQGELERAERAVDVLFKARPDEEWREEESDD
jgi:hypothetical protein